MIKTKPIYRGYTEKEVLRAEATLFVMHFANDFFIADGRYLFTKTEITRLYNSTLKNLASVLKKGNEKDIRHALDLISGLIVRPVRLH